MIRIAVLMTCFNRKDKTMKSLSCLFNQNMPVDVYLVDDGSNDGTGDAIKKKFPEVNVINGDGSLFWNRGMHRAWEVAEQYDYDFYLWLNDDTYIYDYALNMMLEASKQFAYKALIVGASCESSDNLKTSFGADYKGLPVIPNGEVMQCDSFGGNFVLVPKIIYLKCGKLDPYYRHSLGDIDYAKTVLKNGFNIYLAPMHIGECENDSKIAGWKDFTKPFRERYKILHSPLSYSIPKEFFYFYRKHSNIFIAILHWLSIYSKLFIKR